MRHHYPLFFLLSLAIYVVDATAANDAGPDDVRCELATVAFSIHERANFRRLADTIGRLRGPTAARAPFGIPQYRSGDEVAMDKESIRVCQGGKCLVENGYVNKSIDGPGYEVIDRMTKARVYFESGHALLGALNLEIKETPTGRLLAPKGGQSTAADSEALGRPMRQELVAYRVDHELRVLVLPTEAGTRLVRPPESSFRLGQLIARHYTVDGVILTFQNGQNRQYVHLINEPGHEVRRTQSELFSNPEFVSTIEPDLLRDLVAHGEIPRDLIPPEMQDQKHPFGQHPAPPK